MPRATRLLLFFAAGALAGCGTDTPAGPDGTPSPSPATCAAGTPVPGTPNLTSTLVVRGFSAPLDLQTSAGDRTRLFVAEQGGRIRIIRNGAIVGAPFLDISDRISSGGERGLLGLAFHPRYAENGRFYVNYTDRQGHTHIAEFRAASGTADTADAATERLILFVTQPFANHNGGGVAFGNDGFLYIALGDGGSGDDPFGNGQNLATYLGKILRINVDSGTPYAVPPDNPFLSRNAALPEIWAYGLRNPFRISFDRATGDLYIGDVGQSAREEIDVGLASRRGGENYGWDLMEGSICHEPRNGCDRTGLTLPVVDYPRSEGSTVAGGVVYRGCRLPGYRGTYFYGDFGSGFIRSFRLVNGAATESRDVTGMLGRGVDSPVAFGTDAEGEVYIVDYEGEVYRIGPAS